MAGDSGGNSLQATALVNARKSQVVEMRFFGGLTIEETAEELQSHEMR